MAETDLAGLLRPAIFKAAEEALNVGGKELTASATNLVEQVFIASTSAGVAHLVLSFFKIVLSPAESGLEATVAKLRKRDLVAGARELRRVLELAPVNTSESRFRAELAWSARSKLEDARALADEQDRPEIDLLMGMAACLVPGAEEDAVLSLQEFVFAVEAQAKSLEFRASIYDADSAGLAIQAERFANEGLDLLRSARLQRRSREESATAARFRSAAAESRKIVAIIQSITQALQERRQVPERDA